MIIDDPPQLTVGQNHEKQIHSCSRSLELRHTFCLLLFLRCENSLLYSMSSCHVNQGSQRPVLERAAASVGFWGFSTEVLNWSRWLAKMSAQFFLQGLNWLLIERRPRKPAETVSLQGCGLGPWRRLWALSCVHTYAIQLHIWVTLTSKCVGTDIPTLSYQ